MKTLSFATFFAALSGFVVVLIAARILGAENAADFMAYWGMFFAFAGFIDGLMQETTRAVATSAQKSKKVMHAASPWKIGTLIAVILGIITLATSPLWLTYLLSSDHSLAITMLAIGVVSYAYQSILSGTLSGLGLWHHYAGLVALDTPHINAMRMDHTMGITFFPFCHSQRSIKLGHCPHYFKIREARFRDIRRRSFKGIYSACVCSHARFRGNRDFDNRLFACR